MADVKWSDDAAFIPAGNFQAGDEVMGLRGGANVKFQVESSTSANLQDTYNAGLTAEIDLSASRPITINSVTLASTSNGVTTPSTGSNTVSNYRVLGSTFHVTSQKSVVSLQYQDSNFAGGSRTVGLFLKSTGELLASIDVLKTDTLVGPYRTATLNNPVSLVIGVDYVIAAVVPTGEANNLNSDAVPSANVVLTERCVGQVSAFPIPLSFPTTFTVDANNTPAGFFQVEIETTTDSASFNDSTTSATSLYSVSSTTRGVISAPVMTKVQRDAIVSPDIGLQVYNSTYNTIDYFDGVAWQIGLTVDKLNAGTNITLVPEIDGSVTINSSGSGSGGNADYAGWSFSANATATTFAAANTYYPIIINAGSFVDIVSSNFVNEVVSISGRNTPCFRYIDSATQYFNVNINLNVKGAIAAQKQYVFQMSIQRSGGSIVQTGFVSNVILQDLIFPYDISLSGIVQLNTGDRVFVSVQNLTDTSSMTAMYANASIVNVDATQQTAMVWTNVTGTSQAMSPNNGYVTNNVGLVTLSLPATCNFGSEIQVNGNEVGGWQITQGAGQQIFYESASTTIGVTGTVSSTNARACVTLRCILQDQGFLIESTTGAITLA